VGTRIKLSVLLPLVQVATTATLTWWADRVELMVIGESNRARGPFFRLDVLVVYLRQIWRGVNAPALPFSFAGYDATAGQVLGFGLGELIYFAVVAVVWWLAGRYLDRWRGAIIPKPQGTRTTIFAILGIAWGALLFGLTIFSVCYSMPLVMGATMLNSFLFLLHSRFYLLFSYLLSLLWSFALITLNGVTLKRGIGRKAI
jgi:hypothetical protein